MNRPCSTLRWRTSAASHGFGAAWLLFCVGALCASGCAFDTVQPANAPENTCALDDDCLVGTCVDRLCVEPEPEILRVFLTVEPLDDAQRTAPHRWRFAPEEVLGPGVQDLTLPPGVEVVGQVRVDGVTVPADISFTRIQEDLVGVEEALRTRTYADPIIVYVDQERFEADFASVLGGGGVYDVTITPTAAPIASPDGVLPPTSANRLIPPVVRHGVVIPSDVTRFPLRFDIADFSQPCSADLREGCTLTGDVVRPSASGQEQLVDGLQVRAVERSSGRIVSSLGVTDDGRFTIAVAADAGPYALRISAGGDRPLFPEVTADLRFDGTDAPRVEVPSFFAVLYSGSVETAEGVPLADAQVQFRSESVRSEGSALEASLQRTAVTEGGDRAGQFEIWLVAGTYDVIVTPGAVVTTDPRDEPGILAQRVVLGDDVFVVSGQALIVPRRASFGAQILTPSGEPLPVAVEAIPLRRGDGQGLVSLYNRAAATNAGPTGAFDLRLDLGYYDIVAQPPADGGFPWVVFPGVAIAMPGSTNVRVLDIGMPVPHSGIVRGSDGTPLSGARVTAYVLVNDPEGERALQVAATTTDVAGHYRLLLPSRLEPAR